MVSVVGPGAPEAIRKVLGDEAVEGGLGPGDPGPNRVRIIEKAMGGPLILLGQDELEVPGVDLILPAQGAASFHGKLEEAGAAPLSPMGWEVLRIEAGTPAFGVDMSQDTIPIEAGIHHRAIDYEKGCYTGQEVIIRIRDRGQVNKALRHVFLGQAPVPEAGTELFQEGVERARGWITSACRSPRVGQTLAMGYVKRGVEPGDPVRLGSPDGVPGRVKALEEPLPD
jgi:folate-binding protein YgfZ